MGDRCLSYGELEERSNQLARAIAAVRSQAGARVCFLLDKSPDAIITIIGILKAGCIYTPLDPSSPPSRLARIIDSCEPEVVITDSGRLGLIEKALRESSVVPPVIGLVDTGELPDGASKHSFTAADIQRMPDTTVNSTTRPSDPAYILFTSGSTGVPKGVPISHESVSVFVDWANRYFGVTENDRLSGHTAFHFDLSVYDIFGTMAAGAELHQLPPGVSLLPNKVVDFIRQSQLTQWFSVPSVLNYIYKFNVLSQDDFPSLKRVLWCGEVLPTPTLIYWMQNLPHVSFTNLYGPTEATIASSYYTVPAVPDSGTQPVPIGRPCGGETLHILDSDLKPVPEGETGDLYIAGAGLSPGYWRDPEKTASAFIQHDINGRNVRIYRTGDLAFTGDDGEIYFVGRSDTQIKSRGYRIELGEIETALSTIEEVVESAVVAIPSDGFEGSLICCAYAPREDSMVTAADLRRKLQALVPDYMLPGRWTEYKVLPKNGSGKIDRADLKRIFAESR